MTTVITILVIIALLGVGARILGWLLDNAIMVK